MFRLQQGGRAVSIAQNGEAKVVVMDVDSYDRWGSALALLKLIEQSEVFRRAEHALARQRRAG